VIQPKPQNKWSTEVVQAQLRDAADNDAELKNYQNILTFSNDPDTPKKEQHKRALMRGSEPSDQILTFPPIHSHSVKHHIASPASETQSGGQQSKAQESTSATEAPSSSQTAAVNERSGSSSSSSSSSDEHTAVKRTVSRKQIAKHRDATSLEAILIKPPPPGIDGTNALTKEWHDVYAEAQDLALKQAKMAMSSASTHGTTLKMSTTPMQAIIIRPPPMDVDKSNPVFREWSEVYARSQDLAIRQALLVLQMNKNKAAPTQPKPAVAVPNSKPAAMRKTTKEEQLAQEKENPPVEDRCLQCTHAWSDDAFSCLRSACTHLANVDMQQLALDNEIAAVMSRYVRPSDHSSAVVSNMVLPIDGKSAVRTWIRVRDAPGLVGLGLIRGTTTSLKMDKTQLLSAVDMHMLHATGGPTLEEALKPLMQIQDQINAARGHQTSTKMLVELSWAPTLGFTPYHATATTQQESVPTREFIASVIPAHRVPSLASIQSVNESAELAKDLDTGNEALEQTLLHKQELLDALEPEARADQLVQTNQMGRTGERLAGQVCTNTHTHTHTHMYICVPLCKLVRMNVCGTTRWNALQRAWLDMRVCMCVHMC
jgi:hypothetical protein